MPITEWRLDGHIRAADGAGTPFTIIVEALWVRVQLGEPVRGGRARFRGFLKVPCAVEPDR